MLRYFDLDSKGYFTLKGKDDSFYWFHKEDFKTGMLSHLAGKNWFTWQMFEELKQFATEHQIIEAEKIMNYYDSRGLKRDYLEKYG
jgi:hypothetical protein